jgi:2-oxoacid:acceptor oxidoreductase delta subunit (pyruvate/2-ketoisovalerate family)
MKKSKKILKKAPFISISQQNSLANKTGAWRTQKPTRQRGLSPCMANCPSKQDIPQWINAIVEGKFEKAYKIIIKANPFPSLTGRICPHHCENECNRGYFDQTIAIRSLERIVGDWGLKNVAENFPEITRKEKIAIIGSGPAGLSCAYYLRKKGYQITIFEALTTIGGIPAYGIPRFRLPKQVLQKDLKKKILVPEIKIIKAVKIDKLSFLTLLDKFDAVFVAVGASKGKKPDFLKGKAFGVFHGIDFLRNINLGRSRIKTKVNKIIVIGGGNTAIDSARTAKRLGAKVEIFYRRTKNEMPAIKEEVNKAEKEGIKIQELAAPTKLLTINKWVNQIEFQKMKLGEPDKTDRKKPIPVKDSRFLVDADGVILAIGEKTDLFFLPANWRNQNKIFISKQAETVAAAIMSGRENAEIINSHLGSEKALTENWQGKLIKYGIDDLRHCFSHQPRVQNFEESALEITAQAEAKRCFSCGFCNLCDKCRAFCPDIAIKKNEEIEIDYDYCKGCGICVQECPTKSIVFENEIAETKEGSNEKNNDR